MDMGDFIDREASLDDEDEDQRIDAETGQARRKQTNGKKQKEFEDSSEEEDDDDIEEEARIREGFIVSDEEDDEDDEDHATGSRHKKLRKRRRSEAHDDDDAVDRDLDEEDLDLVLENTGEGTRSSKSQFKRLKRGREEARGRRQESRDLNDIFSDDEGDGPNNLDEDDDRFYDRGGRDNDRGGGRGMLDEFDDFIEDDEMSEDGRQPGSDEDMPFRRGAHQRNARGKDTGIAGLREGAILDMEEIFGRGDEYDDMLVTELENVELQEGAQNLELGDVFEPSELAEKYLLEEDTKIRLKDEPERYQLARKPFADLKIGPEELLEEANYITAQMKMKKRLPMDLEEPFADAIKHVLEFITIKNYEVPFIFQHRKDYLIHAEKIYRGEPGNSEYDLHTEKMISQEELWQILDHDLKFRALLEKRNIVRRLYDKLKENLGIEDRLVEDRLPVSDSVDNIQDLQDYLHFQYHSQMKEISLTNGNGRSETQRRPGGNKTLFERIRNGRVYGLVGAFGITSDQFALNVHTNKKREFAEDPEQLPHVIANHFVDPPEFGTSKSALEAAKFMLAEEIFMNPRMRIALRQKWFTTGLIHVNVTEKGVKQIDEQHQYYEFKYLRNQSLRNIATNPSMYLKMMKAESDGLIEIAVELRDEQRYMMDLHDFITSENYSEIADAWNKERIDVVDLAMKKFKTMFNRALREELRKACEDAVAYEIRMNYYRRLDQAPYKPKSLGLGEIPRAFTLSNGRGERGRDAIVGIFMDEEGKVVEHVKYGDLRDEQTQDDLAALLRKIRPDVIGIAGFSVSTNRLAEDVRKLVEDKDITISTDEDDQDEKTPIEVVFVQDEIARLYQNSDRAAVDHPDLPPLARYCVALARYLQNPLLEYAAMGKSITSIPFHPAQQLLSEEKFMQALDSAMVDIVNLVGVDINEAINKPYVANLLPYVCGLGPRKTVELLKSIQSNGGKVYSRTQLLMGIEEKQIEGVFGPCVFENCASFLYIPHEAKDRDLDYLDSTRVHPEDYELGRKMAADALDWDEEDVAASIQEGGPSAVINALVRDGNDDKLNDLILEEYAEVLERSFNQMKRATLEAVRAELQRGYEELRGRFAKLTVEEVFTMLTGETKETLDEGMVVPVNIRRVTDRYASARLDCGIEGNVSVEEMPEEARNLRPANFYHVGQTVQARIESLSRKTFYAELSLLEDKISHPKRADHDYAPDEWDDEREERDKARLAVKNQEQTRTARVIKHPLFKPFNSRQAEEYLQGQSRGDAVIRPSSNGPDHIAVTWKVSDGIFQHIDVLELDKQNEFTVGRTLRVGGKYSYSDLDELIVNHVKSMARKIDELTHNQKFIQGTRSDAEKWLEKYCEANPKRSSYCFAFDTKKPGYFVLLYKAGANSRMGDWPVKVVPGAFQLRDTNFPDVMTLCNGFKTMHTHMTTNSRARPRM